LRCACKAVEPVFQVPVWKYRTRGLVSVLFLCDEAKFDSWFGTICLISFALSLAEPFH
jgi:hypothetical protein